MITADLPLWTPPADLRWRFAGRVPFDRAVAANLRLAARVRRDGQPRVLAFEPAAPVLTLGRRSQRDMSEDLKQSQLLCQSRGVAVQPADRGGLATLHLPGQLVVFVAIALPPFAAPALVRSLLAAAAAVAQSRNIPAHLRDDADAGLWCGDAKLASVGLRMADGVATHGLALNVQVDQQLVSGLTLCGHRNARFADLRSAGPWSCAQAAAAFADHWFDPTILRNLWTSSMGTAT